ncbi:HK97 family phage prohead protease [Turicibacter sanguinis]|uniref:HK97 family phage prohead protease n=1 Tax=Turicibacter sanguinis TaxID=154288 RepID=UPI0006BFFF66|nr:HK97 family phage prohead protease [Turicibacter sanguinis]CUN16648.1 phage prohead protease%2C HK97 family [Turicibacter sanguinis]
MEKRMMNLEFRSIEEGSRNLIGYASTFDENYTLLHDCWGEKFFERVRPGAFTKTLRENEVFMLVNHNWNQVVGRTGVNLTLSEDEHGLRFEIDVPNTTDGEDLLENVRLGLITGCSFGFDITKEKVRWDDDWNFYRDIEEVRLYEVTATPIPAYQSTTIEARSGEANFSVKELREKERGGMPEGVQPQNKEETQQKINQRSAQCMSAFFNGFLNKN